MADLAAVQREHWQRVYRANPGMYGFEPSAPGRYALGLFRDREVSDVIELGAGQGRDTLAFLRAGLAVTALDFAADGVAAIQAGAAAAGVAERLTARVHDARVALPVGDASVDAVYSHMLLSMSFSTSEILGIAGEVRRVLRPGGLHVFTVRHTGDAHFRAGTSHGDGRWEHGGFVVHFFDQDLVDRVADGFRIVEQAELTEGALPRRLWRVTLQKRG